MVDRIERLYVKEHDCDEIRFSWWPEGRMANRHLDVTEEQLLDLLEMAILKGVFSDVFLRDLLMRLATKARFACGRADTGV